MSKITRRSALTVHSRRLTPLEVAQHYFRRGRDFARLIHVECPDFPDPAPDGLYLVKIVESYFDRLHGIGREAGPLANEVESAMRAARGH